MISPHKIKYNGMESTELNMLDLIMDVAFDSDDGEMSTYLTREAIASETHDGRYRRVHGYKYSELFSPKFTFTKENFSDFTMGEVRQVLKWLTSTSRASLLDVYYDEDDNEVSWSAIGGWTEINTHKLANNRTVAITAVFEATTPYALSDLEIHHKETSENTIDKITINTDEPNQPIYPCITIQQDGTTSVVEIDHTMTDDDFWLEGTVYHYGAGNMFYWIDADGEKHDSSTNISGIETTSVVIRNTHKVGDEVVGVFDTLVKNNIKGETIVIDGANRIISSSRTDGRIFGDDFDWQWIPLYEGDNELTFIGNCTAKVEYRTPIKCGDF